MIGMRALTILQFHNITPMHQTYRLWLPVRAFKAQLRHLQRSAMKIVGIEDALAYMRRQLHGGGARPISLTFDNGFADFHRHVLPLLAESGTPAAVLISPDRVGTSVRIGGTKIDFLSKAQLRELDGFGIAVGAYEDMAWNINKIEQATVRMHVRQYKRRLEDILGKPVKYFGVKEGVPSLQIRKLLVETGYDAFLTQCPTHRSPDPYAVGRVQVDDDDFNIFLTKISGTYLFFKDKRSWRYIREYKLDRVAHRLSEALDRLRGKRYGA